MLQTVLPTGVASAFVLHDVDDARLYPEEAAQIAGAVESQRREFATSRLCARRALATLGHRDVAILRGANGAPAWPPGIVGSITHCRGFRAACVARHDRFRGLGLDAEPHGPLPHEIRHLVLRPEEAARATRGAGTVHRDLLVHCAKEAVFKAWFPITGAWLDFLDVEIRWEEEQPRFEADILARRDIASRHGLATMAGRFVVTNGLLIAAVALPRTEVDAPPGCQPTKDACVLQP